MSDKKIELSLEDVFSVIDEKLKSGGEVTFSPKGVSMMPLIKPYRDTVTLKAPSDKLKSGDIVFYRRDNGKFVLHRIIKATGDTFLICGDNQGFPEKGVEQRHMIAVVSKIIRCGREVNFSSLTYKIYVKVLLFKRFWLRCRTLRYTKAIIRRLKKIFKSK